MVGFHRLRNFENKVKLNQISSTLLELKKRSNSEHKQDAHIVLYYMQNIAVL